MLFHFLATVVAPWIINDGLSVCIDHNKWQVGRAKGLPMQKIMHP